LRPAFKGSPGATGTYRTGGGDGCGQDIIEQISGTGTGDGGGI
jgi:hypothetical protein